jgi:hypothetical protein
LIVCCFCNSSEQIPDVTAEIEDQLVGHDTYRRRLAMSRNVKQHDNGAHSIKPQTGLVASLDAVNAQSGTDLPLVRVCMIGAHSFYSLFATG